MSRYKFYKGYDFEITDLEYSLFLELKIPNKLGLHVNISREKNGWEASSFKNGVLFKDVKLLSQAVNNGMDFLIEDFNSEISELEQLAIDEIKEFLSE